jgi:hypothetical protein
MELSSMASLPGAHTASGGADDVRPRAKTARRSRPQAKPQARNFSAHARAKTAAAEDPNEAESRAKLAAHELAVWSHKGAVGPWRGPRIARKG